MCKPHKSNSYKNSSNEWYSTKQQMQERARLKDEI